MKQSYVTPWAETPQWERAAAAAVEDQVTAFVQLAGPGVDKLSRAQKGQFEAVERQATT